MYIVFDVGNTNINKYGEKINKTKEELKYKLEEFINVFNKN